MCTWVQIASSIWALPDAGEGRWWPGKSLWLPTYEGQSLLPPVQTPLWVGAACRLLHLMPLLCDLLCITHAPEYDQLISSLPCSTIHPLGGGEVDGARTVCQSNSCCPLRPRIWPLCAAWVAQRSCILSENSVCSLWHVVSLISSPPSLLPHPPVPLVYYFILLCSSISLYKTAGSVEGMFFSIIETNAVCFHKKISW